MLSPQQTRRVQKFMILIGIGLAVYYWAVFRALSRQAAALDAPLGAVWQKLATNRAGILPDHNGEMRLAILDDKLAQLRNSFNVLDKAETNIAGLIALEPGIQSKMRESFQLIDFQIEEELRTEQLYRLARENNVEIAPGLVSEFPEYRGTETQPALLWAQLSFLDQLLVTATRCKVTSIQNIHLPNIAGHQVRTNEVPYLYEIPLRVEIVGSMAAVSRLLASLPVRADQAKALHLPEPPVSKTALFIHRFIIRKNSLENADEVALDLKACGFVYRDQLVER